MSNLGLLRRVALMAGLSALVSTFFAVPAEAGAKPFVVSGHIEGVPPTGSITVLLAPTSCTDIIRCKDKFILSSEAHRDPQSVTSATYLLWGSTELLRHSPGTLQVVVFTAGGQFASDPFTITGGRVYSVDLSRRISALSIQKNLYLVSKRPFFFVTDRLHTGGGFANEPDPVRTISIGTFTPRVDRVFCGGGSCTSNYLCPGGADWTCDVEVHKADDVLLGDVQVTGSDLDDFVSNLAAATEPPNPTTILVYVHGYNTDFDSALELGVKLSLEAEALPHTTVVFSWPSTADGKAYATDQERAYGSAATAFVSFLNAITSPALQTPKRQIIIVAHSMGVHVVTEGIAKWAASQPLSVPKPFDKIVFFAGDEGVSDWNTTYVRGMTRGQLVASSATSLTIYQSSNDAALISSKCIMHDDYRLGQPDSHIPSLDGINVRDVSSIAGYNSAGHGYLVESAKVAESFSNLIGGSNALGSRLSSLPWLGPNTSGISPLTPHAAEDILCTAANAVFGS